MLTSAFLKGLRDLRRSLPIWVIGAAVMPILVGLLYPSIEAASEELQGYLDAMPEALFQLFIGSAADFASPVGFMDAELFSFMAPIVFIAFGIAVASRQIAGEEEQGTLGLLLAYPVSRSRLLVEKAAVLVVGLLVLGLAHLLAVLVAVSLGGMDIGLGVLLEGHVALFLLALSVAAITFAVGAATGNKGAASGAGAVVGLGSYLLNALAPLNESTEPLRRLSLFYHYGGPDPLRSGLESGRVLVLLTVVAAAAAVSFVTFLRRDIHV